MSSRVIKRISATTGTVTDAKGNSTPVEFTLTVREDLINGNIPGLQEAGGSITFDSVTTAFVLFSSGDKLVLEGGGIKTRIRLKGTNQFEVVGSIQEV